jgi:hypothetical protein
MAVVRSLEAPWCHPACLAIGGGRRAGGAPGVDIHDDAGADDVADLGHARQHVIGELPGVMVVVMAAPHGFRDAPLPYAAADGGARSLEWLESALSLGRHRCAACARIGGASHCGAGPTRNACGRTVAPIITGYCYRRDDIRQLIVGRRAPCAPRRRLRLPIGSRPCPGRTATSCSRHRGSKHRPPEASPPEASKTADRTVSMGVP